jgi:hypothetical protein
LGTTPDSRALCRELADYRNDIYGKLNSLTFLHAEKDVSKRITRFQIIIYNNENV